MAFTAREWLILPEKEQKERAHGLSPHECFGLRTSYAYVHYTEEERANLAEEQRQRITNPPKRELTPLQKGLKTMTLEEQIQYLFYSKERDNDDETMDNPT